MTDKVSPAPLQASKAEILKAISECREDLYLATGSSLLAGERFDRSDCRTIYQALCRANNTLFWVMDEIVEPRFVSSERTEQRGEQQVASDAGASGASPDSPHQSETAAVHYERRPNLDKRISLGDDFAGDAWVRWTAVGHSPHERGENK